MRYKLSRELFDRAVLESVKNFPAGLSDLPDATKKSHAGIMVRNAFKTVVGAHIAGVTDRGRLAGTFTIAYVPQVTADEMVEYILKPRAK